MEKPIKLIDEKTKAYVVESGLESPSQRFTQNVMDQIGANKVPMPVYKPLISTKGWLAVALVIAMSTLLLYFFPISSWESLNIDAMFTSPFDGSWSQRWNPSSTLFYGLFFLGMFLIQIPFLKRMLHKNHH